MSSWDSNPVQAPPGGFNFAGGSSNTSAPTILETTQETPRVPPNTASSTNQDTSVPIQSNSPIRERVSPMDIARQTVAAQKFDPNSTTDRAAKKEADLVASGHMPGLDKVNADNARVRQPGEEDAAGNRIHRKSLLGKLTHWEHRGANDY